MRNKLTIIGAGRVGQTLGRLWAAKRIFDIHDVLNRSLDSSQHATDFIAAGTAIDAWTELRAADVYLIATPDDQIESACDALASSRQFDARSIVFHCSGALGSTVLRAAHLRGAAVASVHPIRSFAVPEQVARDFAGTWCGAEGDARALDILGPAFSSIGAHIAPIDPDRKILYHAAAVFASNYLVTLLDVAQQTYVESGTAPKTALAMMEVLVRETVENVFRLGPEAALTGPIARGDTATVERQQFALNAWHPEHGALYAQFSALTANLAAKRKP